MIKKILVILFIVLLIVLYFILEVNKPQIHSWKYNFSGISKEPFGCFVLRRTLEDHPEMDFQRTTNNTFYNVLPEIKKNNLSVVVVTVRFDPDTVNLSSVYNFVRKGNSMFISAYYFSKEFKDSLKFDVGNLDITSLSSKPDTMNFTNPSLMFGKPVVFQKVSPRVFSKIDTTHHVVLGETSSQKANFIRIPYGKGNFYLHTQPLVFTNYHLLYSNPDYAYRALSYLKNTSLLWDDYYKPEEGKYSAESQTPFRYLLSEDALRMALYLTLILIAIYLFIESKRKQRFVPLVTPLENSTVKFVNTIARLHQGQPDYKKMAVKKFLYFKEMIYSRYLIRLDENNYATALQMSEKTGFSIDKMKEIYIIYRRIDTHISITGDTLIGLSKAIDEFYEYEKDK